MSKKSSNHKKQSSNKPLRQLLIEDMNANKRNVIYNYLKSNSYKNKGEDKLKSDNLTSHILSMHSKWIIECINNTLPDSPSNSRYYERELKWNIFNNDNVFYMGVFVGNEYVILNTFDSSKLQNGRRYIHNAIIDLQQITEETYQQWLKQKAPKLKNKDKHKKHKQNNEPKTTISQQEVHSEILSNIKDTKKVDDLSNLKPNDKSKLKDLFNDD